MEGIVNVLKPPGMSSSDVVVDCRKIFGTKRVGHLGTLDPGASGVLPVAIGRATRLFDYLIDKEKEYIAEIAFGVATDTQDSYGAVIKTDSRIIRAEEIEAVLPMFRGSIDQTAPAYSALSVNGVKMYKLARAGQEVEARVRRIEIHEITLLEHLRENRFLLRIRCSKGTFIRTICADIGEKLGTCAHMAFLLRTASGQFGVEKSFSIAELRHLKEEGRLQNVLVPIDESVSHLPALTLYQLTERQRIRLLNGADVPVKDKAAIEALPDGMLRLYYPEFIGLGKIVNGCVRLCVRLDREEGE